jgi:hypothetical protein
MVSPPRAKLILLLAILAGTAAAQSKSASSAFSPKAITCPPAPADCVVHEGESAIVPERVPENPKPQEEHATFWTFGDSEHAIRSNREAFHDKTWRIT